VYKTTVACLALLLAGLLGRQPAAQAQAKSATPALSFDYFKTQVEPIFLKKGPGHARCIACHGQETTPLDLVPLRNGRTAWTDEESRKNFEAMRHVAVAGNLKSKLLLHPLDEKAGGDFYHNGGKHFASQNDPEWQVLKAWVMGAK